MALFSKTTWTCAIPSIRRPLIKYRPNFNFYCSLVNLLWIAFYSNYITKASNDIAFLNSLIHFVSGHSLNEFYYKQRIQLFCTWNFFQACCLAQNTRNRSFNTLLKRLFRNYKPLATTVIFLFHVYIPDKLYLLNATKRHDSNDTKKKFFFRITCRNSSALGKYPIGMGNAKVYHKKLSLAAKFNNNRLQAGNLTPIAPRIIRFRKLYNENEI